MAGLALRIARDAGVGIQTAPGTKISNGDNPAMWLSNSRVASWQDLCAVAAVCGDSIAATPPAPGGTPSRLPENDLDVLDECRLVPSGDLEVELPAFGRQNTAGRNLDVRHIGRSGGVQLHGEEAGGPHS